jgi:hypothetical protein
MNTLKLIHSFENLLSYARKNTCAHEETYRGGTNWEICSLCGMRWADDEGGKPKDAHEEPKEISDAVLALTYLKTFLLKNVTEAHDCIIVAADRINKTITVELPDNNHINGICLGQSSKILIKND